MTLIIVFFCLGAFAQTDTSKMIVLKNVYITEKKPSFITTSRNITAITNTEMKEKGAQTVSEAISSIPGVSQITTGAISKPVIRGLYGDRIQINVAGLKLEDQQWEDEHGLGLSDVGVERVELIKGPSALLFGSDAMGGVVNVIEEDFPEMGKTDQNLNLKMFSNTYGVGVDYGYKKTAKNSFILRTGIESHADYSDGSGTRVPNTRFALYNIDLGYYIHNDRFTSENRFLSSYNEFGFIADTSDITEDKNEPRMSRKFENAHHTVLFILYSSNNSIRLNETTDAEFSLGFQSNFRQEQERSEEVDMSLVLNTYSLKGLIRKKLEHNWTLTNGVAGMLQTNTNYEGRIVVPDAFIGEGSVYSYISNHKQAGKVNTNFEAGLRFDHRQIDTHQTGSLNLPSADIRPFEKGFNNINGSLGESLNFRNLLLKVDLSSGFRSGNLAELAADGLHEGTPNWYIGNPDMKIEQCLNVDVSSVWHLGPVTIRGSFFRNRFHNYIYLRPTVEELFGFNVFRYEQTNATFMGFEAGATIEKKESLILSADYSYLNAKRDDGTWLPFTPANRFLADCKYYLPSSVSKKLNEYVSFGINYTMKQNHVDTYENGTPGYCLFDAGAGISYKAFRLLFTCRNLTDKLYYDHLSRLKYYGLNNMGRNIILNVGWQF